MNSRDKFNATMRGEPGKSAGGLVPKVEMGYWAGTIRRWFDEGLPKVSAIPDGIFNGEAIMANKNIYANMEKQGDVNVQPVFGLDQFLTKFPVDYSPMFPRKIVEQTETHIMYTDSFGVLNKNDINISSLPMEIESPVKDWKTWNEYKQYYSPETIPKRLPPRWEELVAALKDRDYPIRLGGTYGGFLGFPRQIMGVTEYLIALYDEPELIHDICDTFLNFLMEYYAIIMRDVEVDCVLIWEDMAGRQGSLISPDHFREFLTPRYKALVNHVKELGAEVILTDSDGYVESLLPLIIETEITGMYPFERAAGNDMLRIRENFPDFQILGGIDKRILFKNASEKDIDDELAIAESMLAKGRYIPHIDHFVSEDCTWPLFQYYRSRLNQLIGES